MQMSFKFSKSQRINVKDSSIMTRYCFSITFVAFNINRGDARDWMNDGALLLTSIDS